MSPYAHVLIVEDDHDIASLVARYLRDNRYRATIAADGVEMDRHLAAGDCDLIILDLMLPGENGLDICRRLAGGAHPPIVILTARGDSTDRIIGLEMGAADYLAKPFEPRELLARIRAVLRRTLPDGAPVGPPTSHRHRFTAFEIDARERRLYDRGGAEVILTGAEFDLLLLLVENRGRTMSRDALLEQTRGRTAAPVDRSVDILISRIRRKIEPDPRHPTLIRTMRNGGYVFTGDIPPH